MPGQNKISAGLLMYRVRDGQLEVFLAHPVGPLFRNKDEGHWSIPKGEVESDEDLLAAAIREFEEESGLEPRGDFIDLGAIKQKAGKMVHAWAFAAGVRKNSTLRRDRPRRILPHTPSPRETEGSAAPVSGPVAAGAEFETTMTGAHP